MIFPDYRALFVSTRPTLPRDRYTFQVNLNLNVGDALLLYNGIEMHGLRRMCFRLEVTVAVLAP